ILKTSDDIRIRRSEAFPFVLSPSFCDAPKAHHRRIRPCRRWIGEETDGVRRIRRPPANLTSSNRSDAATPRTSFALALNAKLIGDARRPARRVARHVGHLG